jgi:uncharacterized protein (DUF2267 family)
MATTGLDVFDKTLQTTHTWLDEIMEELGPDRQIAYRALRAVLHTLRDRLSVDEAAHLGAQLPLVIRGVFFESWHPAGKPEKIRSRDAFLQHIAEELSDTRPLDPEDVARAVFRVIDEHVSPGEVQHLLHLLPEPIARLWPRTENTRTLPQHR